MQLTLQKKEYAMYWRVYRNAKLVWVGKKKPEKTKKTDKRCYIIENRRNVENFRIFFTSFYRSFLKFFRVQSIDLRVVYMHARSFR